MTRSYTDPIDKNKSCLMPVIDLLNHHPDVYGRQPYAFAGADILLQASPVVMKDNQLVLVCARDYAAGEEVFSRYDDLTADKAFLQYGFVASAYCPFDAWSVSLQLQPPVR